MTLGDFNTAQDTNLTQLGICMNWIIYFLFMVLMTVVGYNLLIGIVIATVAYFIIFKNIDKFYFLALLLLSILYN